MITLTDLCTYLNELLQVDLYEDFCPNGLQVEGSRDIRTLALAVTSTLHVIESAEKLKADALLVHHGIFWNRDPYPIIGTKKKKIKKLLDADMSLLAYHLPLDAHEHYGNNWKAAKDLEWKNLSSFLTYGVRGEFEPIYVDSLVKKLESYYGQPVRTVQGGQDVVSSAVLISGGAHKELKRASEVPVDCFITGTADLPAYHEAIEEKINFFSVGHSASETVGPKALGAHIAEKFGLQVVFIEENNPF